VRIAYTWSNSYPSSAKISMKLCHASMLDLWKKKLDNGGKSTRYVHPPRPSVTLIINSTKALQLLEYLIKHGSERVVDDARSHISTLKMLRNFHYIDDKGKDEGVNGSSRPSFQLAPTTLMQFRSAQPVPRTGGASFGRRKDSR
jgi:hypothetical protein